MQRSLREGWKTALGGTTNDAVATEMLYPALALQHRVRVMRLVPAEPRPCLLAAASAGRSRPQSRDPQDPAGRGPERLEAGRATVLGRARPILAEPDRDLDRVRPWHRHLYPAPAGAEPYGAVAADPDAHGAETGRRGHLALGVRESEAAAPPRELLRRYHALCRSARAPSGAPAGAEGAPRSRRYRIVSSNVRSVSLWRDRSSSFA